VWTVKRTPTVSRACSVDCETNTNSVPCM